MSTKTTINSAAREAGHISDVLYARQPEKPDWFDAANALHVSATSGSSFLNEWFGFSSRDQSVAYIARHFNRQTFIDGFAFVGGEIYDASNLDYDEDAGAYTVPAGVSPAGLADMVWANSAF